VTSVTLTDYQSPEAPLALVEEVSLDTAPEVASLPTVLPEIPQPESEIVLSPTPTAPDPPPEDHDVFIKRVEEDVLTLTNVERVKNSLKPLSLDDKLAQIAKGHSEDMAENQFFSHINLDNCNSACRAQNAGYEFRALGENLFFMKGFELYSEDAAATIVQGWMGSEGHRKNLLGKSYTRTGTGVVSDGTRVYITTMYARPR
jgi:uncharacterized protein YkwD